MKVHLRVLVPVLAEALGQRESEVEFAGQTVSDLLQHLVYNAGRPIGKTTLLERVFDYQEEIETKTVEKHIWALRQKLEPDPATPCYILNVRGVGYTLGKGSPPDD